ncbi:hypothetical protein [Terricaulis sp.]
MMAVIVAIRDFLIVAALAWVGVTLDTQDRASACSGDRCQTERAQ